MRIKIFGYFLGFEEYGKEVRWILFICELVGSISWYLGLFFIIVKYYCLRGIELMESFKKC